MIAFGVRGNWGDLNMDRTDDNIVSLLHFPNLVIACAYVRECPYFQLTLAEALGEKGHAVCNLLSNSLAEKK